MLNSLPVRLIVGTVLGFLSGLGIGGGSLLILWLTLILGIDPAQARFTNLVFFLPAAAISCYLRVRAGSLRIRPLIPAIVSGCLAAILFSWIGTMVPQTFLRKLFGLLLLAAGIRELFYRPRKER